MTATKSAAVLVRYFCTAGNGMENFLTDEVKTKLAAEDVCQIPGKVFFSTSMDINRVTELKAAERLFLLLKQEPPLCLRPYTNPAKAAAVLQSRIFGDRNQWTKAVMTWSRLRGEVTDKRTTMNIPGIAQGGATKREEGSTIEPEKCTVDCRKCAVGWREASGNGKKTSGKQDRPQPLEIKRKRNDEEEEERGSASQDCPSENNVKKEKIFERKEERGIVMAFHSCQQNGKHGVISGADCIDEDHATPGGDVNMESSMKRMDGIKNALESEASELPSVPVSFRISCKCTGSLSRSLSAQEVSKVLGVGLSRLLGWKVDLKNPELEVTVYLNDDHCLLGIPLTRLPLANRWYMKTTGLRSTVAWAMSSLAQIQPGFCVVDPMCGVGTILIEAAQDQKAACFMGVDIVDGQLQKANENIEFAKLGNRIHLLKASSMELPLPSASVDAVICDLPFGRKFGTKTIMAANLPLILSEMERILCVGGTLVLLLSPNLSSLLKNLVAQNHTGQTSIQEREPESSLQPSTQQHTFHIHQDINSLPTHKPDHQSGLQKSLHPPFFSMKHELTLRVSLGLIDGLIHKYVKMET